MGWLLFLMCYFQAGFNHWYPERYFQNVNRWISQDSLHIQGQSALVGVMAWYQSISHKTRYMYCLNSLILLVQKPEYSRIHPSISIFRSGCNQCPILWGWQNNEINSLATDALAPWVTLLSAAMVPVLAIHDKQILVLHDERFQLPSPPQCRDIIENANIFVFAKINSAQKGLTLYMLNFSVGT